jgi:DNA-binding NtrC family response regulator
MKLSAQILVLISALTSCLLPSAARAGAWVSSGRLSQQQKDDLTRMESTLQKNRGDFKKAAAELKMPETDLTQKAKEFEMNPMAPPSPVPGAK